VIWQNKFLLLTLLCNLYLLHARPCRNVTVDLGGRWVPSILDLGLTRGGELDSCLSLNVRQHQEGMPLPRHTDGRGVDVIRVVAGGHLYVSGLIFAGVLQHQNRHGGSSPVFEVDGGTAVFSNCIFRYYTSTPLKLFSGALRCFNCSFISNSALAVNSNEGGTPTTGDENEETPGGCVQALGGRLVMKQCVFRENWAPLGGGALYIKHCQALVSNCTFDANSCGNNPADMSHDDSSDANPSERTGSSHGSRGAMLGERAFSAPCGGAVLIEYGVKAAGEDAGDGRYRRGTNVSVISSILRLKLLVYEALRYLCMKP
jgi:hypothetical protein